MFAAAIVFFASLVGLALLFTLKAVEAKRDSVFMPGFRMTLDQHAIVLKERLIDLRLILARIPPIIVLIGRYLLHELAIAAAKLARIAEAQAYRVADFVSHKRSFEKRTGPAVGPQSDFLKKVSTVKSKEDENREA